VTDIRDYLAKIGSKGGKATAAKRTKQERSAAARKAVNARWQRTLDQLEAKIDAREKREQRSGGRLRSQKVRRKKGG
jgi:hypothetical protein